MNNIFDIENFNIISDDKNYYFFRALNNADNFDIENYITIGANGEMVNVRTDLSRYDKTPKYNEDDKLSLEEIFDHIKIHHRTDTNCISLSTNANVSLLYGRGYYKDNYILVKVPKNELGDKVVNAGKYMIEETQKRINDLIANGNISEELLSYLNKIGMISSQQELDDFLNDFNKDLQDYSLADNFEKGITYNYKKTNSVDYPALNEIQNLEKNKLIAKLDIINKNIIAGASNKFLIQTIGNAFSSLELTHYGSINKSEIIELPKELVDIFALLQQIPNNYPRVEELKREILNYTLNSNKNISSFEYDDFNLEEEKDYTIDKMYNLTNGTISYFDAIRLYKKSFYLSKSKLRTINTVNQLRHITDNNPIYEEIYNYMLNNTYGVEPNIFSKYNGNKMKVSESVNLDFSAKEEELFSFINSLEKDGLNEVINNPKKTLQYYLGNFQNLEYINMDKDTYYANAIIDLFDWSKLNVVEFNVKQRNDLVNKLVENNISQVYDILKGNNFKEVDIAKILLTIVIKGKEPYQIDVNDMFTAEELDDFLGYYKIKSTDGLKLRSYQATAFKNINKAFKDKQFTSAILPTGAGKSFVALAEMLEYKDKEILYLAPNDEILDQIETYIVKYIHGETTTKTNKQIIKEVFPNLKLQTYSSLLSFNQQEIIDHKYDLIIFDELHRTGAEEWGNHINQLLEKQDLNTKVLGITATPIRDMDNKNMADEWARYFGYTEEEINKHMHLAINMDLIDAIRLGYVVNPKLVSCEYSLNADGSMDNLLEKINSLENEEKRNALIKKFDILRKKVSEADGIDKVLNDNVKMGGKYIVFCPIYNKNGELLEDIDGNEENYRLTGAEVIEKYKKELEKSFEGKEIEFYSMLGSYSRAKNRSELAHFENDDPNKIKFMLVMNKLSEGKHADIDGIIWYRPLDANSFILYHQQLGRVIYSVNPNIELSDDERPIVIDLVNNHLRVNMKKGEINKTSDLDKMILISGWIYEHDYRMPDINSYDKIESSYASSLKKIQEKYEKYINNLELFEEINKSQRQEIEEIINIGNDINLWTFDFPLKTRNENKNQKSDFNLEEFSLTGILKDYYDLSEEVDEIVKPLSFEEKLEEIKDIYLKEGKLPDSKDNRKFSDKSAIIRFWIFSKKENIMELSDKNEIARIIVKEKGWIRLSEEQIFQKRLKEVYDIYIEEGNVPNGTDPRTFYDKSAVRGTWIGKKNIKEKIINLSSTDKIAKIIAEEKGWIGLSKEDRFYKRLEEIYIRSTGDVFKVPRGESSAIFDDGINICYWIENKKDDIKEALNRKNRGAILVAASRKWEGFEHYMDELRMREIYDRADGIIIKIKSLFSKKFNDGYAIIGNWIDTHIEYIEETAKNGNKHAILIAASRRLNGFEHYIEEQKLKEIYEVSDGVIAKVPKSNSSERFYDGSSSMGRWIDSVSEYILDEANKGNKHAILIASSKKWKGFERNLDKERLKEIYEGANGIISKVPKDRSPEKFNYENILKGRYIQHNKQYILEEANKGNKHAILVAASRKWEGFEHYIDDLRLEEIYIKAGGNPNKVPKSNSSEKFDDGSSLIGSWINSNSEYIKEAAKKGNRGAILISQARGWIDFDLAKLNFDSESVFNEVLEQSKEKVDKNDGKVY